MRTVLTAPIVIPLLVLAFLLDLAAEGLQWLMNRLDPLD